MSFDSVDQELIDSLQDKIFCLRAELKRCRKGLVRFRPMWRYGDNYQEELECREIIKRADKVLMETE